MSKALNQAMMILGAIVTLDGRAIEGHLYASVMGSVELDTFNGLIRFLVGQKWITKSGYTLTATSNGRALGEKVNAAMARFESEAVGKK